MEFHFGNFNLANRKLFNTVKQQIRMIFILGSVKVDYANALLLDSIFFDRLCLIS